MIIKYVSTNLGNTAINKLFEKDKVICQLKFQHNLFTMGAIDNTDVDTSSVTAMLSFHGTATSLRQKVLQNNACQQRYIITEFSNNTVMQINIIPLPVTMNRKTKKP